MDKDTLIKILNKGSLTAREKASIVAEYCLEKDKSPDEINALLSTLALINLDYYFTYALDYYKRKFEITTLIDGNGKKYY